MELLRPLHAKYRCPGFSRSAHADVEGRTMVSFNQMMGLQTKKGLALTATILAPVIALFLLAAPMAGAQSSGAIAQGFEADNGRGDIVSGALVSFKGGSHRVELAANDSLDRLAGVANENSPVAITGGAKEVQIVLGGVTNALVSDINGDIHAGDKITASLIAGVGMLAPVGSRIVGTAKSDFDTSDTRTQNVADIHHTNHAVHVGYIPLQVGLSYYQTADSNFLPQFIQNLANSTAGKQVSLIRMLFCIALLLVSVLSLVTLIYSSLRSAITAFSRNPMASGEIRRSLYQVGLVTLVILGAALLACYLVLAI